MKKVTIVMASFFAVVLMAFHADANKLDVSRCSILDGNKKFYLTSSKNSVVYNKSGDILKCSAKKIPNKAKKAVKWNKGNTGYVCSTGHHITNDWSETVSANGNATLTCKFKFPKK